jgi:S-adenosylmethionine synthetase
MCLRNQYSLQNSLQYTQKYYKILKHNILIREKKITIFNGTTLKQWQGSGQLSPTNL